MMASPGDLPDVTVGSGLEREVSGVSLRVRVHRVGFGPCVVGNDAECVEGDAAVGVVAPTFDHFDRAVEEGSDALRLGNGVLLARGEEGPGWAAPYAVERGEDLEGIALGGDSGGRVGRSLREPGGNGEEGREEQGGAS